MKCPLNYIFSLVQRFFVYRYVLSSISQDKEDPNKSQPIDAISIDKLHINNYSSNNSQQACPPPFIVIIVIKRQRYAININKGKVIISKSVMHVLFDRYLSSNGP